MDITQTIIIDMYTTPPTYLIEALRRIGEPSVRAAAERLSDVLLAETSVDGEYRHGVLSAERIDAAELAVEQAVAGS